MYFNFYCSILGESKSSPPRGIMSTNTVLSYPIPAYSNVPIEPQNFQPHQFFINLIVLGFLTLIQTTADMDFVVGQEIRLIIPPSFGCRQLNGISGFVLSIPLSNQIITDINSSQNVDNFILSSATTRAQVLPIGDVNNGIISNTGRNIPTTDVPGSFINISPQA